MINPQVNEKCPYTISRISDSRYALEVDNEEDYGIGLFVDVYPLDGVGNSKAEYSALKNKSSRYALPDNYSAEMIVSNYSEIPYFEETKKALDGMFQEIGYDGIFAVEFMVDADETLWYLEINFISSTWNYAATKLGMNLPILWANAQLKKYF